MQGCAWLSWWLSRIGSLLLRLRSQSARWLIGARRARPINDREREPGVGVSPLPIFCCHPKHSIDGGDCKGAQFNLLTGCIQGV